MPDRPSKGLPEPGQFVDEYRRYMLTKKLAEGGMGAVYEAVQYGIEGFDKRVAIKMILHRYTRNFEFVKMFIGEAKLVADLVHENIVQVYQLGKAQQGYYIAMEYVDGVNLESYLDRHFELGKDLPIELGAFIVSRLCRGLEYAHKKLGRDGKPLGIVHRDVSPKNVMINFEGVVKLTDFGIAKARQLMQQREGEVLMGKVEYMSPEQSKFGQTDRRSDIFSLGIVLFEVLTGHQLFAVEDIYKTLENVQKMPIPDPREYRSETPELLARITLKALQRELDGRYRTAGQMGYDLEHYMYHDRFGPTNVTLSAYLRDLFGKPSEGEAHHDGDTDRLIRRRADTLYTDLT